MLNDTAILQALRNGFPHFSHGEEVTPEAIASIAREWTEMVMGWAPVPTTIEFVDQDGTTRTLKYDAGEPDVSISSGWHIPEDADWKVAEQ